MENKNYHPLDDITTENYQVPQGEEGYYHAVVESPTYDSTTGERLSKPALVKWNKVEGEKMIETCIHQMRMKVRVVHIPSQLQQAKQAANEEESEIAKLKRELEEKDKEMAELKAKAAMAAAVKPEESEEPEDAEPAAEKSEEELMAEQAVKATKPQTKNAKKK